MKKYIFILIIFVISSIGCSQEANVEKELQKNEMVDLLTDYRENLSLFKYVEVEQLYIEIKNMLTKDVFAEDREVLEGYVESLYRAKDEGMQMYQHFLEELPSDYDGIISEIIWEDYNVIFGED
ncbi:hypothetical protein BKP35_07115 [Anaerobacillus arseniciselenatis]|uniref:DUF4363 domain-containing protein n=1 Tax=Anaerobacillus arseniciselenatis TaxID=85682 RepID=A0A1S2LQ61_9BACI|nr:hypothetical protein [Anaerobacillus arseniciselenatis]OIJ14263.1 hypothetical protein BKP35_07115 [Anaerobacillus arseniciselenatis]